MKPTCTHCGAISNTEPDAFGHRNPHRPLYVPQDSRKWYRCSACGRDYVIDPAKHKGRCHNGA